MIRLRGIALARGSKQLFSGLHLDFPLKGCFGLIGPNGAGKSSLLALLSGELLPDAGSIAGPERRIVTLAQSLPQSPLPAWHWLRSSDRQLQAALEAQEQAHASDDALAIASAHEAWVDAGGADAQARVMSLLHGLGFSPAQCEQPVNSLSGGWRMRLNLARALFVPSDLLLLDEPTNHLDLDALIWLERWLRNYEGLVLVASHDRDFLDAVVHSTVHIDQGVVTTTRGGYSAWERALVEQQQVLERQEARQSARRQKLEAFINRFRAQATRARQVQSRLKVLEAMHETLPRRAQQALDLPLDAAQDCPDTLLQVEALEAGHAGSVCVRARNFALRRGDRVGLLGANGAGKSTLVRTLVGELAPITGEARRARHARLAYFAQSAVDQLRLDDSPLVYLRRIAPAWTDQALRDWLGRFAIRGEDAQRAIGPMSGGERARLVLAGLCIHRPHALVLDEPTNHLDALTRDALAASLAEFQGALLLVSHDRYLLNATVDQLWIVREGQLSAFDGDLDDYARFLLAQRRPGPEKSGLSPASSSTTITLAAASPTPPRAQVRQQAAQQRQAMVRELQPIVAALRACEARLEALQDALAVLDARQGVLAPSASAPARPGEPEAGVTSGWASYARERARLDRERLCEEESWLELAQAAEQCRRRYAETPERSTALPDRESRV